MGDVSVSQLGGGGGGRAATSATSRRGAGTVPTARASWPRAAGRSPAPAADTAVTAGSGGGRGAAGWFCGASAAEHRDAEPRRHGAAADASGRQRRIEIGQQL